MHVCFGMIENACPTPPLSHLLVPHTSRVNTYFLFINLSLIQIIQ